MSLVKKRSVLTNNQILTALPNREYQRLLPELNPVHLAFGQVLHDSGEIIRDVYFLDDSIVSLLSVVSEGSTLEVGLVGNEGMTGISVFLGADIAPNRAIVQGAGSAMKMKSATLLREAGVISALHGLLHRYVHSQFVQTSQLAACNRFHSVNARLARWFLMTRDRMGSNEFRVTQEFMSNMLGVRREGVNKAASALQRAKLISYSRGRIKLLDSKGLETRACKCYEVIKTERNAPFE